HRRDPRVHGLLPDEARLRGPADRPVGGGVRGHAPRRLPRVRRLRPAHEGDREAAGAGGRGLHPDGGRAPGAPPLCRPLVPASRHWAGSSYRGTAIHMGAMFGTLMFINVWMRIWPNQRRIITATKNGEKPDPAWVGLAGLRSKHNTYMSVPLVFAMISQHGIW